MTLERIAPEFSGIKRAIIKHPIRLQLKIDYHKDLLQFLRVYHMLGDFMDKPPDLGDLQATVTTVETGGSSKFERV